MLALIAFLPIFVVGVLMLALEWPSTKAMPVGFILALGIAFALWDMPAVWLGAATVAGAINALDILLIVFGALLILGTLRKSGGVDGIAHSMVYVSEDRRIQVILIGFLMGCFFEGAAGFGTPAAVAAPLLVGMGFPPLIAAIVALIGNSVPVVFGAVGTPVIGGFSHLEASVMAAGYPGTFYEFLTSVGGYAAIMNFFIGSFIPIVMVVIMTKITKGSAKDGFKIWPLALIGGVVFTVPQVIISNFVGPEIASLLGALIAIPIFIFVVRRGWFVPDEVWDFPAYEDWDEDWEGAIKAGGDSSVDKEVMSPVRAWSPYVIIGILLVLTRLKWLPFQGILQSFAPGLHDIFGTNISRTLAVFYNPGILPFMLVALLIPFMHGMSASDTKEVWKDTVVQIVPTAIALFFALGLTYIMMNSGEAAGIDSMLIVIAKTLANLVGKAWFIFAPIIGILGAFISGSATVSDIMFSPLQYDAALEAGLQVIPTLSLQVLGGAAGNMICVHNVVAVLTTVGLIGREGRVIRTNLPVSIGFGLAVGLLTTLFVFGFGWTFAM